MAAMPTVREDTAIATETWPQVATTSLGREHELTTMAAIEPPEYPFAEKAAPMERTGGPFGQLVNECKMMSRWPQHPEGVRGVQVELVVDEPLHPSSYIQ